jgi:glycosyltransferase involved in cell wall biosynthesis
MFLPLQPMDVFPDVLGAADVLVALLENDAGPFSVPSKVLSYFCGGRPVLLSAPPSNLSVRLVERAAAGLCVAAGNSQAFVAAADRLRAEPHTRAKFRAAARAYAENAFNISGVADRFEATFGKAVGRNRDDGLWSDRPAPSSPSSV